MVLGTACLISAARDDVVAQEADSAVVDSGGAIPLYKLDGITVTVARTQERIERAPYALGILSAAEIRSLEATISLEESLPQIPGVFINNRHNFALGNRISIRGFGARSQFGVRGIRVIQDGIPLTLADGQSQLNNLDLAAAGRIEVIRGPASSLYGNASGGVISVQTEPAPPIPLGGEIRTVAGGYGNDRTYAKYDVKAWGRSGKVEYIAHVGHFRTDGYRLHSAAEQTLINTRLSYQLDSESSLTAVLNFANAPEAQNPSALTDSLARTKPDTARDIVLATAECPPDPGFGGCQDLGESSKQGQAGVTFRRSFAGEHQISVMGYASFRELFNPIPFTLIELDRRAGGARLEYHHTPANGRLRRLTAGFDVDHQYDDRKESAHDDSGVGEIELDQDEKVTSLGIFAVSRWSLGSELEFTVSARYDRVRFKVKDRLVKEGDPDDSGARTLDQLSPMAGLSYAAASWANVYVNVGRSFQTPTTTELTDTLGGFNQVLEPERATNYEIGLKGTLAGRLSYSLALFLSEIEGQLIRFQPEAIERDFFRNAGSSDHRGLELGATALVAEGLTVSAAYTYSDYEFEAFRTEAGDFSGNQVPGIPPHQFHGRLSYSHGSGFSSAVELTAVDSYFVDNSNDNGNASYAVADLRLGYTAGLKTVALTPFLGINNIFGVRYNSSVVINAMGGRFFEPAPGRNIYAGLRVSLPQE